MWNCLDYLYLSYNQGFYSFLIDDDALLVKSKARSFLLSAFSLFSFGAWPRWESVSHWPPRTPAAGRRNKRADEERNGAIASRWSCCFLRQCACLVACCVIVDFISLRAATHSHKHPERLSDSIRARNWTNIDSTNWFLIGKNILQQLNLIQSQISRLLSKY